MHVIPAPPTQRSSRASRCVAACLVTLVLFSWAVSKVEAALPTVESLIEQLESGDEQNKREAVRDLRQHGAGAAKATPALIEAAKSRDEQICRGAIRALAAIGPEANAALPVLIEALSERDEQHRYRAGVAIGRIARGAQVDLLRPSLTDGNERERQGAAVAVGWLGEDGDALLPLLVERFKDPEADVVDAARESLRQHGARAVPLLVAAINTADEANQINGLKTLAEIGGSANAAESAVRKLLQSETAGVRAAAINSVCRTSPTADDLPTLVGRTLDDDDLTVREAALEAIIRRPKLGVDSLDAIIQQLDSEPRVAELAAIALGRLGDDALPALPALIERLASHDQRMIRASISHMGPSAIPALTAATHGEPPRLSLAQTSEIIGAMGPQALQALTSLIESDDPLDRAVVCRTLGRIGRATDTLELLNEGLKDSNPLVRAAAANGLGAMGQTARESLAALLELASDAEVEVRVASLAALTQVGDNESDLSEVLIDRINDSSPQVRLQAAVSIANLESLPKEAIAPLTSRLDDESSDVRSSVARALGNGSRLPVDVIQPLLGALDDAADNDELAEAIILALGQVKTPTDTLVSALIQALQHKTTAVQLAALSAIAAHEDGAKLATPDVTERLTNASPEIRLAAIRALVRISNKTPERLEILAQGLEDDDWVVRREVADDLGEMERRAKPLVPRLLVMLRHGERDTDREAASSALRRIDAAPGEAVPILMEMLQDKDAGRRERYYALNLLRKAGPDAKQALPLLRELSSEYDGRIRDYIDRTIRDIEDE